MSRRAYWLSVVAVLGSGLALWTLIFWWFDLSAPWKLALGPASILLVGYLLLLRWTFGNNKFID